VRHPRGMPTPPNTRSIKISDDERGGWSSDRPRPGGGPPRKADLSTRCRVLTPSDLLRYSPGSLLMIASASPAARDSFVERLIETKGAVLSLDKVRGLLAGRVPDEQIEERAAELLEAAALKRLEAGETVVVPAEGLDPEERERFVRMAASFRRPRHLILIETARDQVQEEDRAALNELRRRVDTGELGAEGFQTALRLGGGSVSELKRLVFRPAPRDD
jgi:predicted kinase